MIKLEDTNISRIDNVIDIANLSPAYVFDFENISNTVKTIITSCHRRIPIVSKNSNLVGILTYMDILNAILRELSRNTHVSSFMTREIIFCDANESIMSALQKMRISKRGGIPITKDMKLVGMVSERDFIRMFSKKYFNMTIGEVMTHKPFFISQNTSIQTCMKSMVNTHYRRLPVIDNKEVMGIVTGLDILRFINDVNYNPMQMRENITNIMSTPVKHVTEHDDVSEAVKIILEHNIGGLPVIDEENHLKGMLTERDIIELF